MSIQSADAPAVSAVTLSDPVATAAVQALAVWGSRSMADGLNADALRTRLYDLASVAGPRTVASMVADLPMLVASAAGAVGVPGLARLDGPALSRAYEIRNTALSLAAVAALGSGTTPADVLASMGGVPLPSRANGPSRPLCDDEVLLCRHVAEFEVHRSAHAGVRAMVYALVEAGMYPSETTRVVPSDFDDITVPTQVAAFGSGHLASARTLELPAWPARVLTVGLSRAAGYPSRPLTYAGREAPGGAAASASANGVVARMLADAGVRDATTGRKATTPGSVVAWRVRAVYRTGGLEAAAKVSGKGHKAVIDQIHL